MAKFNQPDPRNAGTWCWVNGLVKREDAKVSVLDSVVQGGDAVWEGLRVSKGRIYQLEEHLGRLLASAHALMFEAVPTLDAVRQAVFDTLEANGMSDGVHIRRCTHCCAIHLEPRRTGQEPWTERSSCRPFSAVEKNSTAAPRLGRTITAPSRRAASGSSQ